MGRDLFVASKPLEVFSLNPAPAQTGGSRGAGEPGRNLRGAPALPLAQSAPNRRSGATRSGSRTRARTPRRDRGGGAERSGVARRTRAPIAPRNLWALGPLGPGPWDSLPPTRIEINVGPLYTPGTRLALPGPLSVGGFLSCLVLFCFCLVLGRLLFGLYVYLGFPECGARDSPQARKRK